jgi:hypothetical protein
LAQTRINGSAAARNLKYDVVLKNVHGLQNYVQTLADNAIDEHTAIAIINASGFDLRNKGVRVQPNFSVVNGDVSGTVILKAKSSGNRAAYEWRRSPNNATWTELPPTLQAKVSVDGLTPATIMYFQYRTILKDGATSWSQSVSIVVQ